MRKPTDPTSHQKGPKDPTPMPWDALEAWKDPIPMHTNPHTNGYGDTHTQTLHHTVSGPKNTHTAPRGTPKTPHHARTALPIAPRRNPISLKEGPYDPDGHGAGTPKLPNHATKDTKTRRRTKRGTQNLPTQHHNCTPTPTHGSPTRSRPRHRAPSPEPPPPRSLPAPRGAVRPKSGRRGLS